MVNGNLVQTTTGMIPGFMGLALVGQSLRMLPKDWRDSPKVKMRSMKLMKPVKSMRSISMKHAIKPMAFKPMNRPIRSYVSPQKQTGNLIKGATGIMVGTALLGGVAGIVNKL